MDLQQYLNILRSRWWLILLFGVLGTALSAYYFSQQPPQYRSETTLLLSPALTKDTLSTYIASHSIMPLSYTYAEYLETRTFANLVIEGEDLSLAPDEFSEAIQAGLVSETLFFKISATSTSATEAQQLADAASTYFVEEILRQQREEQRQRQATSDLDQRQSLLEEKLERERQYYEQEVDRLRVQLRTLETAPDTDENREEIAAIQRRLSGIESTLAQVMSDQVALTQSAVDGREQINTLTIIEPAFFPTNPIDYGHPRQIIQVLLLSLGLGLAAAVGLEYLDYTIKSPEELEAIYGEAPLAVIALQKDRELMEESIVLAAPRSATAEALRVLRTNIQFSSADHPLQSIVVTSAGPGEGKSTIALNLAIVMAQAGKKVILVDADLRRPVVHKRLQLSNQHGFTNLVIAESPSDPDTLTQYLQPGPVDSLSILTSGPIPPNPAELLSMKRTLEVLEALEATADIIIYDSPPVATVADAAILASRTDGALQVIQAGQTRRDLVAKAKHVLERVGANVLGPVLNQVEQQNIGDYYYYYYSSYYSDAPEDTVSGNGSGPPASTVPDLNAPALSVGGRFRTLWLNLFSRG